MSLALRYALRDLRGALSSFRIVLMCLFLGVGTIAAVQFTSYAVLTGIAENGRTILGGDLIVRSIFQPAPAALATWFAKRGASTIETVEARVMLANASTDDNTLVELKAVPAAYPLYGTFTIDTGQELGAALADNGIVLDKALQTRLSLNIGDRVRLGEGLFTVRGFIENEPDRAGGSRFGLAPRAMIAADAMSQTALFSTGSMIYYDLRVKLPQESDLQPTLAALKAEFPGANWRITDADNASPQIRRFVDRLVLFLTLVGLSALLIGGIGISNGIRAHMETRLKTIAIFKALGATKGLIERVYLWQIGLMALLGTLAGAAVGAFAPVFAAPYLSGFLPFTVAPQLTWQGFAIPLAFGLLTVAVFALWPLGQAVKTPALELFRSAITPLRGQPGRGFQFATAGFAVVLVALAIGTAEDTSFAAWFVAGAIGSLFMFHAVGQLLAAIAGRLPVPKFPGLRLALRNLHRPGNATANTLVSLGLGLTVMVSVTLIEMNLRYGITQNLPKDAPAFFFMDIQGDQKEGFATLLAQQPSASNIILSPNLRGRIVSVNGVPAAKALVDNSERWLLQNDRGFTYTSKLPAHSEILSGEWWPTDYQGPPLISVVDDVVRGFNVGVGDEITVNILGRDITAKIANTRSVNWMNFTVNFAITFAPGTLETAPHSWLATVVADPEREVEIQRNIGKAYPNISMIRLSDAVNAATDILGNMANAVRITALVAVITGILVLAGSLAATRLQRTYDIVILKVLGIARHTLIAAFLFEFALLGLFASGLALLLGVAVSWGVMVPLMDLPWRLYPLPAILTAVAGAGLTMVIGWLVTGRVLSASAAQHLRNE